MTNKFFPEEQITENDLYFLCYMIEPIARKLHQENKYVVTSIPKDEWPILSTLQPEEDYGAVSYTHLTLPTTSRV